VETIAFYSYKGGSGRSLALLAFASVLSKAGKNVCLIDFDFEAPGLAYKCGVQEKVRSKRRTFFLKYLSKCVRLLESDPGVIGQTMMSKDMERQMARIQDCCVTSRRAGKHRGWIKVIPVGDAEGSEYWQLVREDLSRIFDFAVPDDRVDKKKQFHIWRSSRYRLHWFHRVKECLAEQIAPDYLLVDARAGLMDRNGICTRLWADRVVCFALPNEESLVGTRIALRDLKTASRFFGMAPLRLYVVVSRLPKGELALSEACDHAVTNAVEYLAEPEAGKKRARSLADVVALTEDPIILLDETRIVGPASDMPDDTLLFRDYMDLFENLVRSEDRAAVARIRSEVTREGKIFQINRQSGDMVNPADRARNVAFRVDTFQNLLSRLGGSLAREEIKHGETAAAALKIADDSLRDAGASCGSNFANRLVDKWHSEGHRLRTEERIREWCAFDSDVGFGVFTCRFSPKQTTKGTITLKNSFIRSVKTKPGVDVVSFMSGYIEGVLTRLAGHAMDVKNITQGPPHARKAVRNLVFSFSPKKRS